MSWLQYFVYGALSGMFVVCLFVHFVGSPSYSKNKKKELKKNYKKLQEKLSGQDIDYITEELQLNLEYLWNAKSNDTKKSLYAENIKHIVNEYIPENTQFYVIPFGKDKYIESELQYEYGRKEHWKYPIIRLEKDINNYLPTGIELSKVSYTKDNIPIFLKTDSPVYKFFNDEHYWNDETEECMKQIYNIDGIKKVDMNLVNKCLKYNFLSK